MGARKVRWMPSPLKATQRLCIEFKIILSPVARPESSGPPTNVLDDFINNTIIESLCQPMDLYCPLHFLISHAQATMGSNKKMLNNHCIETVARLIACYQKTSLPIARWLKSSYRSFLSVFVWQGHLEINFAKDVVLKEKIGAGAFGTVYKGMMSSASP